MNTQDLISKWEGMSERERHAECAEIAGVRTGVWPLTGEMYWFNQHGCRRDDPPGYTSPGSPRSLLDGLRKAAIAKTDARDYQNALFVVVAADAGWGSCDLDEADAYDGFNRRTSQLFHEATAEQIAFACYLAVKGRSEGE